jgi:hypothetical protein
MIFEIYLIMILLTWIYQMFSRKARYAQVDALTNRGYTYTELMIIILVTSMIWPVFWGYIIGVRLRWF